MNRTGQNITLVALLLCAAIEARAGNVISISSAEGSPGDEVTVSIALANDDDISSLQVSIPLNDNLTLVEHSGRLGTRCADHSLTLGVRDGVLNVIIYSLNMTAFADKSGEVASFRLLLGDQPQTASLAPSKTVLTDANGTTVGCSSQSGTVTTRCAKAQYSTMEVDFGEVPIRSTYTRTVTVSNVGNAELTVTALTFSDVNVFSSTTTLPLVIDAGSSKSLNITYAPVERGSISRTLKVVCNSVSKLNTISLKAQPYAVNELRVQPVSGISDEEVTVTMTMNNMDAVSGYQVEFNMPSQLEYIDGSFALSERKADHAALATLNGGKLRILVYSGNDNPLAGNDGAIGSFRVRLAGRNGITLTPVNTVLSATINGSVQNVVSAVYGGYIGISSPRISTSSTLNFGAVSLTESCEKTLSISNYGSAPLTVSRIVSDNEALSIKETLPLTIPPHSSSSVTVTYSSLAEESFEATMQIYSNDPDQRLTNVKVTGSRFAPNYLSVSAKEELFTNESARVDVALDNYDAITGLQFDLVYPGQLYRLSDNGISVADRAEGLSVATRVIDDNTLRCFCYFLSGGQVAPGTGKVMTIRLNPNASAVAVGSYQVAVKNITLGTSDLVDKYTGADQQTSFSVIEGLIGDINGDGIVDVSDYIGIANHIMGNTPQGFIERVADVNDDNAIDVSDYIGVANIIMTGSVNGQSAP